MNEEGGDESPPRPKRKIKRVMIVSSSSGSDSEESIAMIRTRRKKLRVISDPEDSDSSGSSVVCGARRRRAVPKLRDSELENDSSDCASNHSKKAVPSTSKITQSGFTSDSSEGNSDKCSICLLRFTNQEIGTPISCEHIFCLDCITEWSKNVNTCPVDRITFESIVVRACIGGRVLRTEPVKEQHPSIEILLATMCEICGRADNEESMLLCDGCDLGYHLQCLTPPLSEVPATEQWLCPDCDVLDVMDFIDISEVDDLFSENSDLTMPLGPRPSFLRAPRNIRRSARSTALNQPSTSRNRGGNRLSLEEAPTTSRGTRTTNTSVTTRKAQKRKRTSRRRTKKVIIEYEIEENGKFPVTRRVTRTVRKRKSRRRQPRTAARRSHVQASVRARLAALRAAAGVRGGAAVGAGVRAGQRAGARAGPALAIPALSLYGDSTQFDYFSDDEVDVSEGASTAVAMRPTSSILNAYRQARRKMITIPSPPHASSAPDVLSNILESQTLLHSKKSIVSVSVDGNVNIKLQKSMSKPFQNQRETTKVEKVDLSKNEDCGKQVPSYPGQSRGGGGGGGGGWGGGYRGSYHREHGANNFNRGNYENNYSSAYQGRQPGSNVFNSNYQNNNMRRDSEPEFFDNFPRRSHQFPPNEESYFDRQRRNPQNDSNRPQNYSNTVRHSEQNQGRFSTGPSWQPYGNAPPASRQDVPPATARHSFGGFENPLDMRMGQMPSRTPHIDSYSRSEPLQQEKPQQSYNPMPEPYQPLPQPPVFNFPKSAELEKSEDERSDSGLVIDTEKYDPTEPTNDDDSGDEHKQLPEPATASVPKLAEIPVSGPEINTPLPPQTPPQPPPHTPPPRSVQSILAGIDTSNMNVPPNVLDSAVRQVLQEHRNLMVSPADKHDNKSDEESDGDCPNFSIYSATSVHIANNTSSLADEMIQARPQHDSMEDLVQEDDDIPTPEAASPTKSDTEIPIEEQEDFLKLDIAPSAIKSVPSTYESSIKNKTEEEYKEKVSKRCPITTNTRNPIKIKLNTPSLIKRVSLYDEEDVSQDVTEKDETAPGDKLESEKPSSPKLNKQQEQLFDGENECHIEERLSGSNDDAAEGDLMVQSENENNSIERSPITPENTNGADENKENNKIDSEDKKDDEDVLDEDRSDDSGNGNTEMSDSEICLSTQSAKEDGTKDKDDEGNIEKMTESISETEDERSYTPCLDENKPKDASFETEKDRALEGLDTEMISEEEGNEMFSENEQPTSVQSKSSPTPPQPAELPVPEVVEKKKTDKKKSDAREEGKKKKKKDSKKEGKDKSKSKKKGEVAFKKLSKSGKERNYRERDRDDKKKKERRSSSEPPESKRKRKEKRKDLERYDVRTLVTEKRRTVKDPFGRDVSPRARSPSPASSPAARSPPARSPAGPKPAARRRRSISRARRSISRARRSLSRARGSMSRVHASPLRSRHTPSRPRRSPIRRSMSRLTPIGMRESPRRRSPIRLGRSPAPRRGRRSPSPRSLTPRVSPSPRRRSPPRKRRRQSGSRPRRRRSASASPRRVNKKKKRTRSERSPSRRRVDKSPHRKVRSRSLELSPGGQIPSPSIDSQLLSPRTPPPEPQDEAPLHLHGRADENGRRRRRDPDRPRRRLRDVPGPSKEVFTSGDNILVSVSFKDQELGEESERRRRRENKRERRRRRRNNAPPETETAKPVAIIDLERSPFRELTPSPENVIVLSDSEPGERDAAEPNAPPPAAAPPAAEPPFPSVAGPKTPPEPGGPEPSGPPVAAVAATPAPPPGERSPAAGPAQPDAPSPDAYDPFEPTRSASASPGSGRSPASEGPPPTPPRTMITLEAAQRTNMSADEVLDRRPLSPAEKVLALLQSTRDHSPEPPPGDAADGGGGGGAAGAPVAAAAPRIVLPSPTRAPPKLFPGKPSPIKSNPVKPMQAVRPPSDGGASPYSPGSSDFGDLFEPRDSFESLLRARRNKGTAAKVPVKLNKKKGKTQVGVKIDDDNLKILDELPSSAVEMQVKSKFLKKLNRQERVVEEVKLVLKPHYNKKHVTKDEYKHILRRAVPKICHNKTGEINPAKIQSLVEAYVKRFRKRRKLGLA